MKFFAIFAAIVAVAVARPGTASWTLQELSDALQNPYVNPEIVPILEEALNDFMDAIYSGQQLESIHVPLPAHIPVFPGPVAPAPVVPSPVPVELPAASSPLVQIIVNVKSQQQVADVVVPSPVAPEIIPTPVQVVEAPEEVDEPEPILVEEIAPEPVLVNPIDIIAVNPVDVWGPSGLNPVAANEDVGPL